MKDLCRMSLKLSSKTLTGNLHSTNKGACDWGWQGFLAYGCQNIVTILDPQSVQVVQSLDKHKGYVVKVKWAKENYHHDLASPYSLRLATADYNGKIIVWNVSQASVTAEFSDGSKPVADMEWLRSQDASQDLLAVLHPPYSLVLWNAVTGTKLWKKSYTETLQAFTFDPFDTSKLAFLGQDCILFVDDFSLSKTPSSNGKKYYISSPNSQGGMNNSNSSEKIAERKPKSTIKIVSSILVGDSSKRTQVDENVAVNDCLELEYHPACRHHLIMLYSRELLILDLEINQTVGIISLDRNASSFLQVMPIRQRDVLMCLHENGSISARVRRKTKEVQVETCQTSGDFGEEFSSLGQGLNYDLKSQSDAFRLTRHSKVYGNACCPVSENKVAIVLSDGRTLFWELTAIDFQDKVSPVTNIAQSPLYTPGPNLPQNLEAQMMTSSTSALNLTSTITPPKTSLSDLLSHMTQSMIAAEDLDNSSVKHGVSLKFVLKGLLHGVAAPPFIVKMCPPLTARNWATYQPLLAVGTSSGNVQIFNMSGGFMAREFSIHTSAVKGIEWCSLVSFMSYASTSPNSNGLVKNEIVLTDIQTGRTTMVRPFKDEESPLELLKVSNLKQYFVVVFKEQPFELWELKTGTRLRQMPVHFPKVTALEWAPYHPSKSGKKKSPGDTTSMTGSSMDLTAGTPSGEVPSRPGMKSPVENSGPVKEHFVFTDTEGILHHFIIDGNIVREGSNIPSNGSWGQISCLAWKGDTLVLADVDGNLNVWDLKARISKAIPTHKGWIKRMKFAPGRGNMKLLVLHNDGTEIWDAKNCEMISSLRFPKDIAKVTDGDWVGSDKPVFACLDGCLKVLDLSLQIGCAPISEFQLQDPVFSPYLLPPRAAQSLKNLLQHQPWCETYSLSVEETEHNMDICGLVNEQMQLIDSDIQAFYQECSFGTAQRCLMTAKLFGDESDLHFWKVALHYLRQEKAGPRKKKMSRSVSGRGDLFVPSTPARETGDLVNLGEVEQTEERVWVFVKDRPLEHSYDVLCDNATFQKNQLDRISLHDQKRTSYEHTRKCAETLMMLGQTDRAVQLLLETEASSEGYYVDCLRACLVASVRSSGASQSTIKLVATNLIANGKLSEGVQLLCLIDKGLDACRYLQTYGEWHQAAWLAKATLDYSESCEVMKRWADHLNTPQVNQKSLSVLVLLSLCKFGEVVEMLYGMRQFDRAALFIEACLEFQLLPDSKEMSSLVEAVFLEYASFQLNISNRKAAEYYCKRAGDKGTLLLQEIVAAFTP